MLTQARLKQMLRYDPDTGLFVRAMDINGGGPAGSLAGSPNHRGYVHIMLDRKMYKAHRLAFLYMTGEMPSGLVDHINGDRSDNRFCNLRVADNSQNKANGDAYATSKTGHRGVIWHSRFGKWTGSVSSRGVRKCIGYFHELQDAVSARNQLAAEMHGQFFRSA